MDHGFDGRCFAANPTLRMIRKGIKKITIITKAGIKIFFMTPGTFLKSKVQNKIKIEAGKYVNFKVIHQVYDLIDFGGEKCIANDDYSQDLCAQELFERKTIGNSLWLTLFRLPQPTPTFVFGVLVSDWSGKD